MDLVLTTERLVLRPYGDQDIPRIEHLADNWNVAGKLGRMPHPYPEGAAAEFLALHDEKRAARQSFPFAITLDGAFIGGMGLDLERSEEWELGYWLGEPYWGRGFATEAGRAVTGFGFGTLGLNHLVAGHFADNPASGRVLEKLGFRYTGRGQRPCRACGCDVDSLEMALDRADWINR
jgi:RimJ/RimL family protein N-acetyltransferase